LVTANVLGNNVSLLIGNGDGTFQAAKTFAVGKSPWAVAVGDFRGAGLLDLAVANRWSNTVSVLFGNGNGTFQPAHDYIVGNNPNSVAVADLTGAGHLDLIVANDGSTFVSVLLGNGDGTFKSAKNYPAGSFPSAVVVGDFAGNGVPDLAVVNESPADQVSILLGNGDGTFQAPKSFAAGPQARSVGVADFSGDGRLDLAVVDAGDVYGNNSELRIFLGNGDGTFQPGVVLPAGTYGWSLAIADLNGDGLDDVVVSTGQGSRVFLSKGNGDFQAAGVFAVGGESLMAPGDFNRDGVLDLAFTLEGDGKVGISLGNGDGTFQAPPSFVAGMAPDSVAVGDFTGNGVDDLVVADYGDAAGNGQGVSILLGNGDGTFQAPLTYKVETRPEAVAVGDFNGDGILDFAVADFGDYYGDNGDVTMFLGNGDGTFHPAGTFAAGIHPVGLALDDLNGDGKLDVVVIDRGTANASTVSVLLGNGDGTFKPPITTSIEPTSPTAVATGDFNGDGTPDVAFVDLYSHVAVLLGNGDGTFKSPHFYGVGNLASSVAVGDFDANGDLDLAVTSEGDQNVSILLGKGDGTFGTAMKYKAGNALGVVTADFSQNGRLDLAVATEALRLLPGNGDGTFQTPATSYAEWNQQPAEAVGDFNGDGLPDVVIASAWTNDVKILLNDRSGTSSSRPQVAEPMARANVDAQGIGVPQPVALNPGFDLRPQDDRSQAIGDPTQKATSKLFVPLTEADRPPVTTVALDRAPPWINPARGLKLDPDDLLAWPGQITI
jgi:hypothetical protein